MPRFGFWQFVPGSSTLIVDQAHVGALAVRDPAVELQGDREERRPLEVVGPASSRLSGSRSSA